MPITWQDISIQPNWVKCKYKFENQKIYSIPPFTEYVLHILFTTFRREIQKLDLALKKYLSISFNFNASAWYIGRIERKLFDKQIYKFKSPVSKRSNKSFFCRPNDHRSL